MRGSTHETSPCSDEALSSCGEALSSRGLIPQAQAAGSNLSIGTLNLTSRLIQAPLAGISCAPFRSLAWQFGGVAYCCTEMLSASELSQDITRHPRYRQRADNEQLLCWQLSGNCPDQLAQAAANAAAAGADIIDLNCGCPQPKIRKKTCGSKLLQDASHLNRLVQAIKAHVTVPVTVKIRVDKGHQESADLAVAKACAEAGADALIVHGRNWRDDYGVPVCYDSIARVVESVDIPVIGNGDVSDADSLRQLFAETGCAGAMIARASVGQPWLFQQLSTELAGGVYAAPSNQKIGELLVSHVTHLAELEGETKAVMQARRFAKYYARTLSNAGDFAQAVNSAVDLAQLQALATEYFTDPLRAADYNP